MTVNIKVLKRFENCGFIYVSYLMKGKEALQENSCQSFYFALIFFKKSGATNCSFLFFFHIFFFGLNTHIAFVLSLSYFIPKELKLAINDPEIILSDVLKS